MGSLGFVLEADVVWGFIQLRSIEFPNDIRTSNSLVIDAKVKRQIRQVGTEIFNYLV